MSLNAVQVLRDREVFGQGNSQRLRMELNEILRDMCRHEWAYDHPATYDIMKYLQNKIHSNLYFLHTLYCCYKKIEHDVDKNIVWLATDYGCKVDDFDLLLLCDEVKQFSL